MLTQNLEIVQLLPATGWRAMYYDVDDYFVTPLVAWALIKTTEGHSDLVGLVSDDEVGGEMSVADWDDCFIGFLWPGQDHPSPADLASRFDVTREMLERKEAEEGYDDEEDEEDDWED